MQALCKFAKKSDKEMSISMFLSITNSQESATIFQIYPELLYNSSRNFVAASHHI